MYGFARAGTTVKVNDVDSGKVKLVKDIDIQVTDGSSPVTPDSTSLVGNTLTIAAPTGGGGVTRSTATLMQTGQSTSYQTGDDVSLQSEGRATDFLTLDTAPLHNDSSATLNTTTNRFTDDLGGSTYTNNIVLDWSTWNGSTLLGLYLTDFSTLQLETWSNGNINAAALTVAGFATWKLPNRNELINIMRNDSGNVFNYAPFNNTTLTVTWSSSTDPSATSSALTRSGATLISRGKTATSYSIRCRIFSLSTLNVLT